MKNLVILMTVFVILFLAVPAITAQSRFFDFFGSQQSVARPRVAGSVFNNGDSSNIGVTNGNSKPIQANVREEDYDDLLDLAREEIRQTFADKGFTVVETEEESATFVVSVKMFSQERKGCYSNSYYSYCYHNLPEDIVFVTVKDRVSGVVIVSGEGKKKDNLHRAIEKSAESTADKLKKKKADRTIFLP